MREIRKIAPKPTGPIKRKRVAAYARVSSGKEAMLHSLSTQVSYYNSYIGGRSDWEFAGIYADEALTGTKDARPEFQRLLTDCRAGKIDMVITKSITRFARNTVTLLETVRELKMLGIDVFFEKENIHTLSADGELMLTLLASFAQEESRSASENQKWRIRKMFEEGRPNTGKMLGYRLLDGKLHVVPEEAVIVRQIFADYLDGMGIAAIANKLNRAGIAPARGVYWKDHTIRTVLRNEKYSGNMLLQKTYRFDHISKKKMVNRGERPKYYVENSHEAIIDKDTFAAVRDEIARRAVIYPVRHAVSAYPFTGIIRCGKCGAAYGRKHTATGTKYNKIAWICAASNKMGKDKCDSQRIPESILMERAA